MGFIKDKKYAFMFTFLILIIGTIVYFQLYNLNLNLPSLPSPKVIDQTKNNNSLLVNSPKKEINNNVNINVNDPLNYIIESNKFFIKPDGDSIDLFYRYTVKDNINIELVEGNLNDYMIYKIAGQNYYPLILGYDEAQMMKEERIFSKVGDPITDFFGNKVVVIGIIKKNNSILDNLHISPLEKDQLIGNESSKEDDLKDFQDQNITEGSNLSENQTNINLKENSSISSIDNNNNNTQNNSISNSSIVIKINPTNNTK